MGAGRGLKLGEAGLEAGRWGGAGRGLEVDGGAGRSWRWTSGARRGGAMGRGGAGRWSEEHGGGHARAAPTPRDRMGWAWGFHERHRPRLGRGAECGRAPLGGSVPAVGLCGARACCWPAWARVPSEGGWRRPCGRLVSPSEGDVGEATRRWRRRLSPAAEKRGERLRPGPRGAYG